MKNDIPDNNEEITYKQIKKAVKNIVGSEKLESEEIAQDSRAVLNAKLIEVQIYGQQQFLDLQKEWANHIKWQIWAVLGFQFLFVAAIGFNLGEFTNNINKLPYMYALVVLQTLANIVALGFVVAKFLFPDQTKFKNDLK